MFDKKHRLEDSICMIFGMLLGAFLLYIFKTNLIFNDFLEYVVRFATIGTLIGILYAKKSLDSTIESIEIAKKSLEEAQKNTKIARKSFDKTVEKQKKEEKLKVLAMINSLLEELRVNFNICCSSFLKRFRWNEHYQLFCKLKDSGNLYYSNPTDDIDGLKVKLMQMLNIFYENGKEYGISDFTQNENTIIKIISSNHYPEDIKTYYEEVKNAFINNPNIEIPQNIKYIIWEKDFINNITDLKIYSNKDSDSKHFITNLATNSLVNLLSSGLLLTWKDPNNKRLFVNAGELHFSIISKFNLYLNKETIDSFNHRYYILWTHFRLVFLILDILEIFKDKKEIFVNTNFVNEVYNQIGI